MLKGCLYEGWPQGNSLLYRDWLISHMEKRRHFGKERGSVERWKNADPDDFTL